MELFCLKGACVRGWTFEYGHMHKNGIVFGKKPFKEFSFRHAERVLRNLINCAKKSVVLSDPSLCHK